MMVYLIGCAIVFIALLLLFAFDKYYSNRRLIGKLKIGDTVLIIDKGLREESNPCGHVQDMDKYIGNTGKIVTIYEDLTYEIEGCGGWSWPECCLEKRLK